MIDLRSDTFTVPTEGMRKAIYEAPVGDDVWGEDPTVNKLQEKLAEMFGKEAALFVPSGTMGNQISLAVLAGPGDEAVMDADAHIYYYETGAAAVVSRLNIKLIKTNDGMMPLKEIEAAVRPSDYWFPKTKLICLENTHNRHGGTIIELDYINKLADFVQKNNFRFHCDGARIWHAIAEREISPAEYTKHFDTVNVCFSKGLGAPVGSAILGSREIIADALRWRKILGGGMRQAGIIAAGAIYALDNHLQLLKHDHEKARKLARKIAANELVDIKLSSVQTNILAFKLDDSVHADVFTDECRKLGLLLAPIGGNRIRAVIHFQISDSQIDEAGEIIHKSIKNSK